MKRKILTIDDDPDILDVLMLTLQDEFDIVQAHDGQEGLKKAQEILPDLIITDVMMPKMDGFHVCAMLKKDKRFQNIPIILLTGRLAEDDKATGKEVKADVYLNKPFNPPELLTAVKSLINKPGFCNTKSAPKGSAD